MVFKYFLEPVRKSLCNCSSMAIKWGRFPHFSKFGPKAAGSCKLLHDLHGKEPKTTQKSEIPILVAG